MPRKKSGLVQVKLRISEDLKRRLDREARKRDDGSLSAEIAKRLEQSFISHEIAVNDLKTFLHEEIQKVVGPQGGLLGPHLDNLRAERERRDQTHSTKSDEGKKP